MRKPAKYNETNELITSHELTDAKLARLQERTARASEAFRKASSRLEVLSDQQKQMRAL